MVRLLQLHLLTKYTPPANSNQDIIVAPRCLFLLIFIFIISLYLQHYSGKIMTRLW